MALRPIVHFFFRSLRPQHAAPCFPREFSPSTYWYTFPCPSTCSYIFLISSFRLSVDSLVTILQSVDILICIFCINAVFARQRTGTRFPVRRRADNNSSARCCSPYRRADNNPSARRRAHLNFSARRPLVALTVLSASFQHTPLIESIFNVIVGEITIFLFVVSLMFLQV